MPEIIHNNQNSADSVRTKDFSCIVTFGEIMQRLSPKTGDRLRLANTYDVYYGGAEANVAATLRGLSVNSSFVTKLPDNYIGEGAYTVLKSAGVNTDNIITGGKGERLGVYYLERGASQRASKVVYDRGNSSFALSGADEYDWEKILYGAKHFHITGITPALGDGVRQAANNGCKEAKKLGISISLDINYRALLWDTESAKTAIGELLQYADICLTNVYQADMLFSTSGNHPDESEEGCLSAAKNICSEFGCKSVGFTRRNTVSADYNILSGVYYKEGEIAFSREYAINIIDRVGAGDAFAAGIIYGEINGYSPRDTADFAAALCALKHTVNGDFAQFTKEEVIAVIKSGNGMIQR